LQEKLAKMKLPRNKDFNLLEKFRTMRGTSTSSSSRKKQDEFFSPQKSPKEEEIDVEGHEESHDYFPETNPQRLRDEQIQRKIDEESKIPVVEDQELESLIGLRLEEIQDKDKPEELERIQVKVTSTSQLVYEIPMPTNDPKLVEEVLKLFITHVESQGKGQVQSDEKKYNVNTKIVGLHTLVGKTKIPNDYEELDKNLQ